MFDVFYLSKKPNLFPHEQRVSSLEEAQRLSRTRFFWIIDYLCDYTGWDFLWEPVPWQAEFVHVWPSQWHQHSGTYFVSKTGSVTDYHFHTQVINIRPHTDDFTFGNTKCEFDCTWAPHPLDPPYIYVFGNQHWTPEIMPTVEYQMPGATERKYVRDTTAHLIATTDNWCVVTEHSVDFDYSWCPDPGDPPYIYVFGNQHWSGPVMPTVEYRAPGATERKFMSYPQAKLKPNMGKWSIPDTIDASTFDFTWHPDPGSPPYIYQFGTQHQRTGGPRYVVPGATEVKYISTIRAKRTEVDTDNWCVPSNVDTTDFDFTWHPDETTTTPYIYQFGTQHQRTGGPRYVVPGATEVKYISTIRAKRTEVDTDNWCIPGNIDTTDFDFTWHPDETTTIPYIYQFGTQWQATGGPQYIVPGATEVKYVSAPRAAATLISEYWEVPENVDTSTFDFTWHPDSRDQPYIYQFGTQHQRTGGPRYVVPGATEVKYVDQIRIQATDMSAHLYGINHMDGNELPECVKTTRYVDNYLDTLKRISNNVPHDHEFIWIVSSVCDYTNFDFSWHPEHWQATMLHVFASDGEKFGDTFFMHVPTFKDRIQRCELLDWYDLNFVEGVSVPRHALPVIQHDNDTHVEAIKTAQWSGPLAILTVDGNIPDVPCVPLWREKTKTIVPLSAGASSVVVPKVAVPYVKTQLYDYSYIDKTHATGTDAPLDVVFISNGESCAEHNLWVLKSSLGDTPKNKVHVVSNVNGRAAAYHAAARASTTPWFFAVFAKLEVDWYFPWEWQPDRMQEPKHYIFHAHNEVNRLEYGHQAMIAYNKNLVLNNPGVGLDFTLDSAHEVVPILSGIARYCSSPWMAWRTAFREVLKLRASLPDVESEYRIKQWLTPRDPKHTVIVNQEWSHIGAEDAMDYYDSVNGDFDALKKSYEWEWLTTYAMIKRNLLPS